MNDSRHMLSNTTKHDGGQTVKCLVTKQCLMVFGRQTFIVCPGPKMFGHQTMFDGVWSPNIYRLDWPSRW